MLAYGVAIETLVSPGGPKHRHGLPYDHASFEQWEMRPAFTAQELEPAIRRITLDIEQLLAAAAKSRRLLPTLVLLSEFCDNTSKNFGLQFRRLYQNAACRAVERELKLLPGHGMDLAGLAERLRRILESTFTPRSIFEKKLANAIAQKRYGRDRKPSGEENKRFEALRSSAKRLMARKRGPAKRS
jgi:hypothetical protein